MNDHEQYREWTAAFVLGALGPDDRAAFETHLAGCEACLTDVADLAPVAGLLNRIEIDAETAPPRVAELATTAIREEWTAMQRSRRRWQSATGVAAAALAIMFIVPALSGDDQDQGTSISLSPGSAASGTVQVVPKTWGTAVQIQVTNLPESETYIAWAVGADGTWEQMATWGPTPSSSAKVDGASSIAAAELSQVVITTADKARAVGVATLDSSLP